MLDRSSERKQWLVQSNPLCLLPLLLAVAYTPNGPRAAPTAHSLELVIKEEVLTDEIPTRILSTRSH